MGIISIVVFVNDFYRPFGGTPPNEMSRAAR